MILYKNPLNTQKFHRYYFFHQKESPSNYIFEPHDVLIREQQHQANMVFFVLSQTTQPCMGNCLIESLSHQHVIHVHNQNQQGHVFFQDKFF